MRRLSGMILMVSMLMVMSCRNGDNADDRTEARELFRQLSELNRSFTSSVASAPDSAAWAKITLAYEDSLAKINFRFPPDTDLEMSQGENDTLFSLTSAYIAARDTRIHEILHPKVHMDSIAHPDSLTVEDNLSKRISVPSTNSPH